MTITLDSLIEVSLKQINAAGMVLNAYQYQVTGIGIGTDAADIAEGWWNHVKTTQRALVGAAFGACMQTVRIRELNNSAGDYAEWNIPVAEQTGTRSTPTQNEVLPPFVAAGVRLTVGTRLTRPGQKRYGFLFENDVASASLNSAYVSLLQAHMAVISAEMTLGAPAALTVLQPIVCRRDPAGTVIAHQNVLGYLVNPYATSQNSRKMGYGA